jgi:hypothetical protein
MRDETQRILVEYEKTIDKNLNVIEQGKFLVDGLAGVSDTSRVGITQDDLIALEQQGTPLDRSIQDRINDYNPMTVNVDSRLVAIASSITTIKTEIYNLIVQAIGAGPGTGCGQSTGICTNYTGGISTCLVGYGQLKNDLFQVRVQNMSNRSYVDLDPASYSTSTLSSSNVGVRSFNIVSKDGGTAIGYTATIVNTGGCSSYYTQVTNKYAEIDTLRSEADTLISTINVAKRERSSLQYERWAIFYGNEQAAQENTRLRTTSSNIQSSTLEPYV